MAGLELFKRLGVGAKFDLKRFSNDAKRLQVFPKNKSEDDLARPLEGNPLKRTKSDELKYASPLKQRKIESEESSSESEPESEPEPDTELTILGNLTSTEAGQRLKKKKVKTKQKLAALHQEEVNRLRNQFKINAFGTDLPEPLNCFDDLITKYKLSTDVVQNLQKMGYTDPTPIQRQAIPAMIHKREVMACAPTGSGKTAAFIIPIIHCLKKHSKKGIRALVLAPTRELAKQINRDFQRISEGTGLMIDNMDKPQPDGSIKPVNNLDILISTPNRLIYQLKQDSIQINLHIVEWLVVDESDKLFEEGKTGFRDQLAVIYKACDSKSIKRAMFSATFAYDVEEWCRLNLDNVIQVYVGAKNSATQTIEQELQFVGSELGKLYAIRELIRKGIKPPLLVFVQSKERAQELFSELIYDGMNVDVIHSERPQVQRDQVVSNFRSGKVWILICTELMGRGIDFKGVNLVINYDFPTSAISYIHRIGRTGRAGRQGKAITFFTEEDTVNLRSIANIMAEAGCPVPQYMLQMKKPSKKRRKKLAKSVPKRERISTAIKSDTEKASKRRELMRKKKMNRLKSEKRSVPKEQQSKTSHIEGKNWKGKKQSNSSGSHNGVSKKEKKTVKKKKIKKL